MSPRPSSWLGLLGLRLRIGACVMSNDDHERLIRVAANWYGLYNELFVKAQRLTIERDDLLASWRRLDETHRALQADTRVVFDQNNAYYAEIQRLRAALAAVVEGERE